MEYYATTSNTLSISLKELLHVETKPFVILSVAIFAAYYSLFSYFHFGLVVFGSIYYIYYIIASAFVLTILESTSIAIALYFRNMKLSAGSNERKDLYAIILSIIPSTMCCTPVIPSIVVAVFGSGGIALASGSLNGLLSVYSPLFIAVAALILVYSIFSSMKKLKEGKCKCRGFL